MKNIQRIGLSLFFGLTTFFLSKAQVSINTDNSSPDASAILDLKSSSKGMLAPRMSTSQRTMIASPATGLLVYDTDTQSFWFRNSSAWEELPSPKTAFVFSTGTSTSANDYIGEGTSSSIFLRNSIVIPFNCELTSITLSVRGAIGTYTATVWKANGSLPLLPATTALTVTNTTGSAYSVGTGSILVSQGDLISVRISSGNVDGATVSISYK